MAMNLMDMVLRGAGQQSAMQAGQQVGLNPDQTQQAVAALLPAISAGLRRNANQGEGLQGLIGAVTGGGHARYIDNPQMMGQPETIADGNAILGHLFGSKDVSRQVAAHASQQTGLGTDVLKKMLPMVAAMAMGSLGKQTRAQPSMQSMLMGMAAQKMMGGSQGGLGGLLGAAMGGAAQQAPQRGGLGGLIGSVLGGGARSRPAARQVGQSPQGGMDGPEGGLGMFARMLDTDGDGNPMDDILGQFMR